MMNEKDVEAKIRQLEQESAQRFINREKSLIESAVRRLSNYLLAVTGEAMSEDEITYLTSTVATFFEATGDFFKSFVDGFNHIIQRKKSN